MFDSHSRNIGGFPSPIGTSVLLKFGSVYEVQEYIREVYFAQASNMSQYYQIHYLNAVPPPEEVRHFILETLGRKRQRETSIAKRTQLMPCARATIREQSHKRQQKRRCKLPEFEKNDITLKNTLFQKSKRKKYSTEKAVANFKEEVKKGRFTSVLSAIGPCISGLFRYLRKISTKLKLARYLITWFVVLTENSIFA